jgi:molybdenum cofactor cytidylyltransferase
VIAALLLAAGAARRFGGAKLLQDLYGKPVVRWSAEALHQPLVGEIVVVVPPEHSAIRAALAGLDVRFAVNPDPGQGLGSSIASGMTLIGAAADAVIIALADAPRPSATALGRVVSRYRRGGARIVVPRLRGGVRAHPVPFYRSIFGELAALANDEGARAVTDRDPGRLVFVEVDEVAPSDIDTPEDLARLRGATHHTRTSNT